MSSTATWTEHDLTVGANNLHYARMGVRSGPPVVLLHGFSDAGPCWIRFASDLATEYDLILPDAAGHGRSSAPTQGEALGRAVTDVFGLLDALGLDQVAMVGHSMGASAAARGPARAGHGRLARDGARPALPSTARHRGRRAWGHCLARGGRGGDPPEPEHPRGARAGGGSQYSARAVRGIPVGGARLPRRGSSRGGYPPLSVSLAAPRSGRAARGAALVE